MYKIADNIVSPLGVTTEENLQAVLEGKSALCLYDKYTGLQEPFCASNFSSEQQTKLSCRGLSSFESYAVSSIHNALQDVSFDFSGDDVVLILSSTKGNVDTLYAHKEDFVPPYCLGDSARRIACEVGITTNPIVVSNACISGVSALHLARLLLDSGYYRYAVVCGVDVQSLFTITGFQSLKAVSVAPCRPFDIERVGLNLGEAAATMVLASDDVVDAEKDGLWHIGRTAVRNDAFHLTSPSKTAEGSFQALSEVMKGIDAANLGFLNLHGTATLFNDQMEAVAVGRAGLQSVPSNGLKGYYGHTMGAAGVLETVLSMAASDRGILPGTRGFAELGVSVPLNLSSTRQEVPKHSFVKLISGFGGGNGALLACKREGINQPMWDSDGGEMKQKKRQNLTVTHSVSITTGRLKVDRRLYEMPECDASSFFTELYKRFVGDYPKFYKMDLLSKLGFLASELLLQAEGKERFVKRSDRAVLLFNRTGSLHADNAYLQTIRDPNQFYPSPSLFIYTLPNMSAGEIAIRNKYQGETAFYVLQERNQPLIEQIVKVSLLEASTRSVLYGWLDVEDDSHFEAELMLGFLN